MKLTGDQITTLNEFADGADCQIGKPESGLSDMQVRQRVKVTRIEDRQQVYIYDTGGIERVPTNG